MKVKISFVVDVTEEERLAIGHYYGKDDKPAKRDDIEEFFLEHGKDCDLAPYVRDYYRAQADKFVRLAEVTEQEEDSIPVPNL